jgi:hypothetical protein
MTLDDWYDHDSLIEQVLIDVVTRTVSVKVLAYDGGPGSTKRVSFTIVFEKVDAVNTAADLGELAANTFAGHVNHAKLAEGPGTSYLYLVEGYMSVTAGSAPRLI